MHGGTCSLFAPPPSQLARLRGRVSSSFPASPAREPATDWLQGAGGSAGSGYPGFRCAAVGEAVRTSAVGSVPWRLEGGGDQRARRPERFRSVGRVTQIPREGWGRRAGLRPLRVRGWLESGRLSGRGWLCARGVGGRPMWGPGGGGAARNRASRHVSHRPGTYPALGGACGARVVSGRGLREKEAFLPLRPEQRPDYLPVPTRLP